MISLVNRDRGGVPPLRENGQLDSAAQAHSVKMASSSNMSHDGWDSEIAASGFAPGPPGMTGQNIAMRSGGYSPDAIESMFFNDAANDGHRRTSQRELPPGQDRLRDQQRTGVYW